MVDHRKRERIEQSDDVHIFLCMQRNKDNEVLRYPTIYRRIIRNFEEDLQYLRAIAKERGGVWRIYRTVNKRSFEKGNNLFKHRLIDDFDDYFYRLDSLWKTCLLKKSSRAEKRFLIDVDGDMVLCKKVMSKMDEEGIEFLELLTTPNGFHIVVKPFDRRIFAEWKDVEVLVDGYVFIEIIGDEKPQKIEALINHLLGTCKTFSEGCTDLCIIEDDLTEKEFKQLDEEIFHCAGCSWWFEISDANDDNGEQVCNNCKEED